MKIKIPTDYTLPEDVADGEMLEELVTFRVDGDSLVPTMLAGVEIAADESEEDEMEDEAADEMEAGVSPMAGMGERIMGMA
jgi:mannose/fructose/N-acetylgalactosamine-specific phosphotransferase system component IID